MVATFTARPDLIQVTYKVLSDKLLDPEKKAKSIAWGHRGAVLGIDERTHVAEQPYEYYLTVGFPPQDTEGDIPTLLTMIFGQLSMDGKVRLESIQFPDSYLKGKGPRFGIEGIRRMVGETTTDSPHPHPLPSERGEGRAQPGVRGGKPLAMASFKPGVGLTPPELGNMFYELACGGMHLVKDDEILQDQALCPTEARLEACLSAGERARRETGQMTLYAVNLTGPVTKIVAKARKLAKQGAQCFLLNVLCYGYGLLEELREVGVPLMAHPALAGVWCGSMDTGMSYAVVLGSLMRLAGADIVLFPSNYGTAALPSRETQAIKEALTWTMGVFPKSFPAPSAGIHPGLVPKIIQDYGREVIINAGNVVHSHPAGARAGAKAFRQAITWIVQRGNFGGISEREFPELMEALRLWGKK